MELPPLPRDVRAGKDEDVELVNRRLFAAGVGDGHPVIPPTAARVEDMLGGADPRRSLGLLAPLRREVTVEDVAVCAVLAGCPREALPILTAAVGAVQEERFNLLGVTTTTGSAGVGVVLHGAAVTSVGANAGANCLGPGNLANATIGRALATVIRVVGAAVPGSIDVAICGQPAKYGLCFAELPGITDWPALYEERGLPPDSPAVTVLGVTGTLEVVDATSQDLNDLLDTLAASFLLPVGNSSDGATVGSGEPVVVIPPEWVGRLREAGWTKQSVREQLWERAVLPLDRLRGTMRARVDERAEASGQLRVAEQPDDIVLIVAGGPGTKATLLPLWPGGSASVTVPVTG
ncbi:MAG: hypothetical protein M3443_07335 [Actinomycetota bacterium]|nr:hypothetical protein [Actinomycetota bacterium]